VTARRTGHLSAERRLSTTVEPDGGATGSDAASATLDDLLERSAASAGDAVALTWDAGRLTYGELRLAVHRCAAALARCGVRRSDRVAMLSAPSWEHTVVFLACARLGAIFVGLNPRHRIPEHEFVLQDADPVIVLAHRRPMGIESSAAIAALGRHRTLVHEPTIVDAPTPSGTGFEALLVLGDGRPSTKLSVTDDPVGLVYTSGSTGRRKGVPLTHRGLLAVYTGMLERTGLSHPINCLNDLPIDHLGGLVERLIPSLLSGGTVVLHERFDATRFLSDAARHRVNFLQGEVTQWLRCVALDEFETADLSSVEVALITGAAVPQHLLKTLCARFPCVLTGWGMSETSGGVTKTDPLRPDSTPGVVGRPIRGASIKLIAEDGSVADGGTAGEICVKGPMVMPGYFNREPDEKVIDSDGWLHTGDIGVHLPDGSLQLVGRRSQMYKSGGYNVYPKEVEVVLEAHPTVAHAVVVAVPDREFQEVGHAFVLPADRARPSPQSLVDYCRQHLATYKCPRDITIASEFPLLSNGKVDRVTLRTVAEQTRSEARMLAGRRAPGTGSRGDSGR
jgi:acyl-CoA synthetase (AMP-forming)/AMP-acid ligase II